MSQRSNWVATVLTLVTVIYSPLTFGQVSQIGESSDATVRSVFDQELGAAELPSGWLNELYFRLAVDGAKQPQDFGVNANLGGQASVNWAAPLVPDLGIGIQAGTGITASANAVRVYELLGENTGRTQHFTTVGFFQRHPSGVSWGVVHDFLDQKSFDHFQLGQWRFRAEYEWDSANQFGFNGMVSSGDDQGLFGGVTLVRLQSIDQWNLYWRHIWESNAQTTAWLGIASRHGEDNAVTGYSPEKENQILLGADLLMPLNDYLAIYGETNLIMPPDTGTVDAFLGIQWYPGGRVPTARRRKFSPMQELAAPTSFAVDLQRL